MRYLTLGEVVALHRLILTATGGAPGIRDMAALESSVAQPRTSFGGTDLHRSLVENAAALGFALAQGHAFAVTPRCIGLHERRAAARWTAASRALRTRS